MHDKSRTEQAAKVRELLMSRHPITRADGPLDELPVEQEIRVLSADMAFGEIWSRPGLDMSMRSVITISVLATLGRGDQLRTHLNAGLNNGLSAEQIVEILFHIGAYAGVASYSMGLAIAHEVFLERGILKKP
jgi:3-oxoadipate enol-lactonase/4-carboxymuconolactone decarboxylase